MEWFIGIFTMMAVMVAIIGGGTGVRLMYIDGAYERIISRIEERAAEITARDMTEKTATEPQAKRSAKTTPNQLLRNEELARLRAKRDANRHGVIGDGVCVVLVLIVGSATALGFSPSLSLSMLAAFVIFLTTMIPFYDHARTVLWGSRTYA